MSKKWYHVSDKLPKKTGPVLVCSDGNYACRVYNAEKHYFEDIEGCQSPAVKCRFITHWQPLPRLPKDDKGA